MSFEPLGNITNLVALYQAVKKLSKDKAALKSALSDIASSANEIFSNDRAFVLHLLTSNQAIASELISKKMDKRNRLIQLFKDAYDEAPGLTWSSHHEKLVDQFVTSVSRILLSYGINEFQASADYVDSEAQQRHEEAQQTAFDTQELLRDLKLKLDVGQLTNTLGKNQQNRQEADSLNGSSKAHRLPAATSSFTGRTEALEALSKRLRGDVQVIHGLGGVGKTQLAIKFALTHEEEYDVIWRVRSGGSSSIAADLAELAVSLRLAADEAQTDKKLSRLQNWLAGNSRWLLIFDDLQELAELNKVFALESSFQGKVLIASRNSNWGNFAESIPLDIWIEEESVQFLKTRLRAGKYNDEEELNALGRLLGNLPLALEQAAAYVNATPSNVQAYSILFTERRTELWRDKRHEIHPDDYPYTVATTWTLSIEKIQEVSLGALILLQVCSFFAPDDIPLSLLVWGKEILPEPLTTTLDDSLALNQVLAALSDYSLLSWQDEFLGVHQLVQAVVRDSIAEPIPLLESVLKLQLTGFPFQEQNSDTWAGSDLLVRHMLISSKLASQTEADKTLVTTIMNEAVRFLRFKSSKSFESTLPTLEQMHSNTVDVIEALGKTIDDQEASLENILQVQQQTLDMVREEFRKNHWRYAFAASKLGHIYSEIAIATGRDGALEEAEALHREALTIMETKVSANEFEKMDLVYYMHSLAKTLLLAGEHPEAKQYLELCLKVVKKDSQSPSAYLATVLEYLGYASFRDKIGKWSAQKFFKTARETYETLGNQEKSLLNAFNYAMSLENCGQGSAADSIFKSIPDELKISYLETFTYLTKGLPPSDLIKTAREALNEIVEIRKRDG